MLAAQTQDVDRRRAALGVLFDAYWYPLYAFVRRRGYSPEDAADLTQAFLVHLLEKEALDAVDPAVGPFRAFLLTSAKNFLSNQRAHEAARKRGGDWIRVTPDTGEFERRYLAAQSSSDDPERLFDRQWAQTVLARAIDRLCQDEATARREREFAALAPYLTTDGGGDRPYREVAAGLGLSEGAVRTALHRLRQRFGAALRAEVAETVVDEVAIDHELRHVLSVLSA